ncbi:MAG: hypothetical protein ACI841_002972, partial [Planctomycetota bacterium]
MRTFMAYVGGRGALGRAAGSMAGILVLKLRNQV